MGNAATMATPHLLMKLDKENMAKTLFKLHASDLCADRCLCSRVSCKGAKSAGGDCVYISKYSQQ
jgi:hypothetical protein